jgi:hypothetical protein
VGEAPNERRGVQVLNDGDAKFGHDSGARGRFSIAERNFFCGSRI